MLRRFIQHIDPAGVPPMTRPSYRRELVTSVTMPAAVALVEGGVVGVMALKVFGVSPVQLAMITAAPMFANLTSFFWARLSRGRRKVPTINAIQIAALLTIGGIALLPVNAAGAWALTLLVVAARCLLTGIVTLRSTVWRHNYPRHTRGRITARLAVMVSIVLFATPLLGGLMLDLNPHSFRVIYPAGMLIALVGVYHFSRIRLRGERELLRYERRPGARPSRRGDAAALYEYDERRPRRPNLWSIFRDDPLFRRYMLWQFVAGVSNMMLEPVVIDLVSRRTESVRGDFLLSVSLTQAIPALMMILTLPLWAKLLDRVHIARFRVAQAWLWLLAQVLMWVGAIWAGSLIGGLLVFGIGRLVLGVARGGGVLAWNLGHHDFASREMVAFYMGIHVTLTGVRGAFAPFLGMALYTGWPSVAVGGLTIPGFAGLGGHVFGLAAALSAIALLGFGSLARQVSPAPAPD